jgi:hypothetical protein
MFVRIECLLKLSVETDLEGLVYLDLGAVSVTPSALGKSPD